MFKKDQKLSLKRTTDEVIAECKLNATSEDKQKEYRAYLKKLGYIEYKEAQADGKKGMYVPTEKGEKAGISILKSKDATYAFAVYPFNIFELLCETEKINQEESNKDEDEAIDVIPDWDELNQLTSSTVGQEDELAALLNDEDDEDDNSITETSDEDETKTDEEAEKSTVATTEKKAFAKEKEPIPQSAVSQSSPKTYITRDAKANYSKELARKNLMMEDFVAVSIKTTGIYSTDTITAMKIVSADGNVCYNVDFKNKDIAEELRRAMAIIGSRAILTYDSDFLANMMSNTINSIGADIKVRKADYSVIAIAHNHVDVTNLSLDNLTKLLRIENVDDASTYLAIINRLEDIIMIKNNYGYIH